MNDILTIAFLIIIYFILETQKINHKYKVVGILVLSSVYLYLFKHFSEKKKMKHFEGFLVEPMDSPIAKSYYSGGMGFDIGKRENVENLSKSYENVLNVDSAKDYKRQQKEPFADISDGFVFGKLGEPAKKDDLGTPQIERLYSGELVLIKTMSDKYFLKLPNMLLFDKIVPKNLPRKLRIEKVNDIDSKDKDANVILNGDIVYIKMTDARGNDMYYDFNNEEFNVQDRKYIISNTESVTNKDGTSSKIQALDIGKSVKIKILGQDEESWLVVDGNVIRNDGNVFKATEFMIVKHKGDRCGPLWMFDADESEYLEEDRDEPIKEEKKEDNVFIPIKEEKKEDNVFIPIKDDSKDQKTNESSSTTTAKTNETSETSLKKNEGYQNYINGLVGYERAIGSELDYVDTSSQSASNHILPQKTSEISLIEHVFSKKPITKEEFRNYSNEVFTVEFFEGDAFSNNLVYGDLDYIPDKHDKRYQNIVYAGDLLSIVNDGKMLAALENELALTASDMKIGLKKLRLEKEKMDYSKLSPIFLGNEVMIRFNPFDKYKLKNGQLLENKFIIQSAVEKDSKKLLKYGAEIRFWSPSESKYLSLDSDMKLGWAENEEKASVFTLVPSTACGPMWRHGNDLRQSGLRNKKPI